MQANFKTDDGTLINLYADNAAEMAGLLGATQELAADISATAEALRAPRTTEQAVATIQQTFPGSQVIVDGPTFSYPSPAGRGANSPREAGLAAKGFVPDKYHDGPDKGGFWHPQKFEQAPACQCATANQGKLALKVAMGKNGKEYSGWFCANTFNASKAKGCPASFTGPFPEV